MNPSCTQKIKFTKIIKDHTNFTLKQVMQILKNRNTPTSYTHILMQIMQDISVAGDISSQHLNYLMSPYYTGVLGNNPRHKDAVPMQKQEQCIPLC